MKKNRIINVGGIGIGIKEVDTQKYVSLTDIAKKKNSEEPRFVIINWLRNRNTIEFLGIWEKIHNSKFNRVGFDTVRLQAGLNSFTISPSKWIETTNAKGIFTIFKIQYDWYEGEHEETLLGKNASSEEFEKDLIKAKEFAESLIGKEIKEGEYYGK